MRLRVSEPVHFGTTFFGFSDWRDHSLLRLRGTLTFLGRAWVGRGARWDIAEGAHVTIGAATRFSPFTLLVISNSLNIGDRCAISWGVQILDDDWHSITVAGVLRPRSAPVIIGNHVLVGSRVTILKGSRIGDDSIVASNSVVSGDFGSESGVLLAGNPAKIVRRNVSWA